MEGNVPFNNNNNNNNNLHLYSTNLYMNIFGCALQYCCIKFMLKVTNTARNMAFTVTENPRLIFENAAFC